MLQNNAIEEGQLVVGLDYEYEFLSNPLYGTRSIPNINRERTNNSTTSIFASYGITDRIGLLLIAPYRSVTNEKLLFRGQKKSKYAGGKYIRHAEGLGDLVLMLNYAPPLPAGWPTVLLSGGVKLANGSIDAKDKYGDRFSDNLQIGSGSVDPVFALNIAQNVGAFTFSGIVFTRISARENIYGYKYGNELHSIAAVDYHGGDLFYAGLSLNHLLTTRDTYQYGKITRERGGKWLYVAPRVGVNILDNVSFELRAPVAVYQNVNESQLTSRYQLQINTAYHITF